MFISLAFSPATLVRNNTWRHCRCRGAVLSTGPAPLLVQSNVFNATTKSAVVTAARYRTQPGAPAMCCHHLLPSFAAIICCHHWPWT